MRRHGSGRPTSLAWLNEKGKLDGRQSERLGSLLWKRVDATGVPVVPGFYSFACMTLPHPAEVDPEPRIKEHLRSLVAEQATGSNLDHVLDELGKFRRNRQVVGIGGSGIARRAIGVVEPKQAFAALPDASTVRVPRCEYETHRGENRQCPVGGVFACSRRH